MSAAAPLRAATAADAEAIAALHAASWRSAYRGIFSDHYLEHEVGAERLALWRARFAPGARADLRVEVVDGADGLDGFHAVFLDGDVAWGALLDNLHVRPRLKRRGLGRRLIAAAARRVLDERPGAGLHLWCYAANEPTRRFYDALGGEVVERVVKADLGGVSAESLRYAWRDPRALAAAWP